MGEIFGAFFEINVVFHYMYDIGLMYGMDHSGMEWITRVEPTQIDLFLISRDPEGFTYITRVEEPIREIPRNLLQRR